MFFQYFAILTALFFLCFKFGDAKGDARVYVVTMRDVSFRGYSRTMCVGLVLPAVEQNPQDYDKFFKIMFSIIEKREPDYDVVQIYEITKDELLDFEELGTYEKEMSVLDLSKIYDNSTGEANFKTKEKSKDEKETALETVENIVCDSVKKFWPNVQIKIKSGRSHILRSTNKKNKAVKPHEPGRIEKFFKKTKNKLEEYFEEKARQQVFSMVMERKR
eukprot:Platyproteum_vivax@DN4133_c0_g1_i2.p1